MILGYIYITLKIFDKYDSNIDCGYNPSKGANGCNGAWLSAYPKYIAGN